ncbi:MAG: Do family serine endopeptidase [Acidobacteria bacterium]|nr:MAG: Do family serine endopeptidase [Acidobacteriota bacterium]
MQNGLRQQLTVLTIVVTLGVGIAIGAFVSHGARAAHPASSAGEPQPLAVPSPVELSNSFSRIAEQVEPAVVNINTESTVRISGRGFGSRGGDDSLDDFFNRFFRFGGPGDAPENYQRRNLGSGVILDPRGYVLTNYHVVMQRDPDREVDRIEVYLHAGDGTKYRATIVGADKWTDLAVIKIDAGRNLPAAQFGASSSVKVGDWVLAIGSPFGLESTVTAGIISAKGREIGLGREEQFKRYIQTDAAINPGNSGGPLVNMAGQVIGINTAIATSRGSNDGVGFAIPSDTARAIYNSLITSGKIQRGAIGVTFLDQSNPALLRSFGAEHGVVVNNVEPGSPAENAGLKMGDVILSINGLPVSSGDDLVEIVSRSKIGGRVKMDLLRDGKRMTTSVEVADRNRILAQQQTVLPHNDNRNSPEEAGGVLGASVRNLTPDQASQLTKALHLARPQGILVTRVVPEGFAAEISVQAGDILLSINHQPVSSLEDFVRIQSALRSDQDVLLLVARHSGSSFTTMFLADTLH